MKRLASKKQRDDVFHSPRATCIFVLISLLILNGFASTIFAPARAQANVTNLDAIPSASSPVCFGKENDDRFPAHDPERRHAKCCILCARGGELGPNLYTVKESESGASRSELSAKVANPTSVSPLAVSICRICAWSSRAPPIFS